MLVLSGVCCSYFCFLINKHKQKVNEQVCSWTSDVIGWILINKQRTLHGLSRTVHEQWAKYDLTNFKKSVSGGIRNRLKCDWALQQRQADSLGRSESNGVWVYLFRSSVDLPSRSGKKYRFPGRWCFNNFWAIWDRALILPPSYFSR